MQAPELLVKAVRDVLRGKARDGSTTKKDAALAVMGKIEKAGGPTKFGIGAAALRMAFAHIIDVEITRQLKMGLTDHEQKYILPAGTPAEIIAELGKVSRWISISDGSEAVWVPALQASPVHWMDNAALKEKKARQTQTKANASMDIARFLMTNHFASLEEALTKGV